MGCNQSLFDVRSVGTSNEELAKFYTLYLPRFKCHTQETTHSSLRLCTYTHSSLINIHYCDNFPGPDPQTPSNTAICIINGKELNLHRSGHPKRHLQLFYYRLAPTSKLNALRVNLGPESKMGLHRHPSCIPSTLSRRDLVALLGVKFNCDNPLSRSARGFLWLCHLTLCELLRSTSQVFGIKSNKNK